MKSEARSLSKRQGHSRGQVADRVKKELEALNIRRLASAIPEGVVPLNPGFFTLQEIRNKKAAKARTVDVKKRMQS